AVGDDPRAVTSVPRPLSTAAYYATTPVDTTRVTTWHQLLIRADITFLKPDFSTTLEVQKPGPWPRLQRFDFLVRTREATAEEVEEARRPRSTYPQRQAVLWAIRELEKIAVVPRP